MKRLKTSQEIFRLYWEIRTRVFTNRLFTAKEREEEAVRIYDAYEKVALIEQSNVIVQYLESCVVEAKELCKQLEETLEDEQAVWTEE